MSDGSSNHEWNQFINSMNAVVAQNSEFQHQGNSTSSGPQLFDLATSSSGYPNLDDYSLQNPQEQMLRDHYFQQQPQSHQQQPLHQAKPLSNTNVRRVVQTPYTRPTVSSPLAGTISKTTKTVSPQHDSISNQFPPSTSNMYTTDGLSSVSSSASGFDNLFQPSSHQTTKSTDGNDSDPSLINNNNNDRIERGKRVHREAEKQRRESLRIGFEKLKDLLPTSSTIGSDKSWSQTRLLETGLEYIVALQKEADAKLAENGKLKDALRKVVAAHAESEKD
jgi:hypothetical protein